MYPFQSQGLSVLLNLSQPPLHLSRRGLSLALFSLVMPFPAFVFLYSSRLSLPLQGIADAIPKLHNSIAVLLQRCSNPSQSKNRISQDGMPLLESYHQPSFLRAFNLVWTLSLTLGTIPRLNTPASAHLPIDGPKKPSPSYPPSLES